MAHGAALRCACSAAYVCARKPARVEAADAQDGAACMTALAPAPLCNSWSAPRARVDVQACYITPCWAVFGCTVHRSLACHDVVRAVPVRA